MEILTIIISSLSLLMSTFLTILIIRQTNINTKEQRSLQERINNRQSEFEDRQLKVQQRPERIDTIKTIYKIYSYVDLIMSYKKHASSKTFKQKGEFLEQSYN